MFYHHFIYKIRRGLHGHFKLTPVQIQEVRRIASALLYHRDFSLDRYFIQKRPPTSGAVQTKQKSKIRRGLHGYLSGESTPMQYLTSHLFL